MTTVLTFSYVTRTELHFGKTWYKSSRTTFDPAKWIWKNMSTNIHYWTQASQGFSFLGGNLNVMGYEEDKQF